MSAMQPNVNEGERESGDEPSVVRNSGRGTPSGTRPTAKLYMKRSWKSGVWLVYVHKRGSNVKEPVRDFSMLVISELKAWQIRNDCVF